MQKKNLKRSVRASYRRTSKKKPERERCDERVYEPGKSKQSAQECLRKGERELKGRRKKDEGGDIARPVRGGNGPQSSQKPRHREGKKRLTRKRRIRSNENKKTRSVGNG